LTTISNANAIAFGVRVGGIIVGVVGLRMMRL
jgi:hypothetical protein